MQAELPDNPPSTQNAKLSAENLEIGRVENLRLLDDDEWLHPFASQIPSLTDLDLTPHSAVSIALSQALLTARHQRNVRIPARFASADLSAALLPSQSYVAPVPLTQQLAPAINSAQTCLPRADRKFELPSHFAQVRKIA